MLDKDRLPSNPVRLPRGPKTYELTVTADGYSPIVTKFRAEKTDSVRIRLRKDPTHRIKKSRDREVLKL
jgi:hypothetical protein